MAALRERVQNVGNAQDRAKNKYDPLTHPVRFFRKTDNEARKVGIESFKSKIDNHQADLKRKNDQLAQQWIQSSMETGRKKKTLKQTKAMGNLESAAAADIDLE